MKTIGIIGGLGPETTAHFYLQLIYEAFKLNQAQRPPVLMWSIPMDYEVEAAFIKGQERGEEYVGFLMDAAQRLEIGGADFIVIPCNSVHIFLKEVRAAVKIPVLSIVEETVKFLREQQVEEVGLLATKASLKAGLYQEALAEAGMELVTPEEKDQEQLGELINQLVRNERSAVQKKALQEIIKRLADQGPQTILLACTDLQLLVPEFAGVKIYDTMMILVEATVREGLK